MEENLVSQTQALDFSLIALFLRATFTVKLVMLTLVASSFWSWSIIIQKSFDFYHAKKDKRIFLDEFWSGMALEELYNEKKDLQNGICGQIFCAAMDEWHRSVSNSGRLIDGAQTRIDRAMYVVLDRWNEKLTSGLYFLATVGSVSPFVGLFGTVWGIKNAFQEIAIQESSNLAVVAPGIAEALLATALGLLAAIPAVIFYNKLSGDSQKIIGGIEEFTEEFSVIMSRHIDMNKDDK
jgi:biopolymer transport protein TolQ